MLGEKRLVEKTKGGNILCEKMEGVCRRFNKKIDKEERKI